MGMASGHVATVRDVRTRAIPIGMQDVGPNKLATLLSDVANIRRCQPSTKGFVPTNLRRKIIRVAGANDGFEDLPEAVLVSWSRFTNLKHRQSCFPANSRSPGATRATEVQDSLTMKP